MKLAFSNKKYWKTVSASQIIGENSIPSAEFFGNVSHGSTVLDIGCGNGAMAEFVSKKGFNVVGLDINEEAISKNRKRKTNVQFVVGDITKRLPFERGTFDAVLLSFVLVNIISMKEREKLASEITRILKPRGIVWLNEALVSKDYEERYSFSKPFLENNHDFFVFKKGILASSFKKKEDIDVAVKEGHIVRLSHHFTIEELKKIFRGYRVIDKKLSFTQSLNTGSKVEMITIVFEKK